jgi:hypothetical protein
MAIVLRGVKSYNNGGDGIRVEGNVDLHARDVEVWGNGGTGVNILRHGPYLRALHLPEETDPQALAQLLHQLQQVPPQARTEAIHTSGILQKMGKLTVDAASIVANIVTIAGSQQVQAIVARLASQ